MNLKQPLALSEEFKAVIDQLENTKDNLFITGRAGTGKSTLSNYSEGLLKRSLLY